MWRILLVASIFCASCVTSSSKSERQEISGLEEMSLEYIETQWGKPDYNLPTRKGRTVKFEKINTRDVDPVSNYVTERICIIRLEIDQEGLVEQWDYESCVNKNPEQEKEQMAVDAADDNADDYDIEEREAPEIFDLDSLPEN
ncbi:MAG: hypothetical protein ACOH5I_14245 [Oligoflexus sp.]